VRPATSRIDSVGVANSIMVATYRQRMAERDQFVRALDHMLSQLTESDLFFAFFSHRSTHSSLRSGCC
jgi:hypothetical protein